MKQLILLLVVLSSCTTIQQNKQQSKYLKDVTCIDTDKINKFANFEEIKDDTNSSVKYNKCVKIILTVDNSDVEKELK